MLRGRSKDRNRKVTPPGPVYMSNEQFADYLAGLRNNRVSRPSGARPLPTSNRRSSDRETSTTPQPTEPISSPSAGSEPRSASALSHRRAQSSLSTYSSVASRTGRALVQQPYAGASDKILKPSDVVPSATYIERGLRWMEKEEAVSLRGAMEDMNINKLDEEETRIYAAAQNEASELVWQHQNPQPATTADGPYRYKEHLRKNSYQHARTQSVGRYGGLGMATGLARDIPRSVSGESSSSDGINSQRSRNSSGSSEYSKLDRTISPDPGLRCSMDSIQQTTSPAVAPKSYGNIAGVSKVQGASRRRSSGKRNISGELAGTFTGEQIWEEPEQETSGCAPATEAQDIPAPLRMKPKNPMNRVQFAHDTVRSSSAPSQSTKKLSRFEIHRNPPSQSRNPAYTANQTPAVKASEPRSETPTKNGLEIRSDEIRQATSMRLKDRSPKLPTPVIVSDKPDRPIVSFDANWKPKEADVKAEVRNEAGSRPSYGQRQSIPSQSHSEDVAAHIPTIHLPDTHSTQINEAPAVSVPTICFQDSTQSVPIINFPNVPRISVSAPSIPTVNIESSETKSTSKRPLPDPKTAAGRPPRHHTTAPNPRSHWSPAGKRATAACHQCQMPIEGRVVGLRGAVEKYHPECFICFTCGTGLEALEVFEEPPQMRTQRLDRIDRRARGEAIEEIEGQTMPEDGDARLRYFCHLDWHELYAPKCKHCKTAILGEHTIALGEHWHFGHFFCAECGDPFEQGMSHIEKDGYAWCINCQTKRTERRAPKCNSCRLPVIGAVVQAMGGEWHDKCFRCVTCKGDFPDGSFFPKDVNGETVVVCTKCMERELKV